MKDLEERFSTFEKRYKQEYAELSHMAYVLEESSKEQIKHMAQLKEISDYHLKKLANDADELREANRQLLERAIDFENSTMQQQMSGQEKVQSEIASFKEELLPELETLIDKRAHIVVGSLISSSKPPP